jgi:DNA-binding MarR family transcriptional regulator
MSGTDVITDTEQELADRLRVAVMRLHRRLRQQSVEGLSPAQVSLLGSLQRLGFPTLGELASEEQVQPPTMTRLVAGLEASGLVERLPDPDDGRVSRVRLSTDGAETLRRIRSIKTAFLTRRLASLSPDERAVLDSASSILRRLTEEP